jgi:predicted phosphodiesterase
MRLAVISDIHGNLPALEAVLADVKYRGVDATVNLGDCVTRVQTQLSQYATRAAR